MTTRSGLRRSALKLAETEADAPSVAETRLAVSEVEAAGRAEITFSPGIDAHLEYFMDMARRVASSPEGSGREPENLNDAIYEMCRQDFWRRFNKGLAELQSDPEAWADYVAEGEMVTAPHCPD